jgi:hypothetical protein
MPAIITTTVPTSSPSSVPQSSLPLTSISERENVDSIPILDGTEVNPSGPSDMPVNANDVVPLRSALHIDSLAPTRGQRTSLSTRTARTQSTEFSSISSNTNSYANTVSPVSPAQPTDFVAPDGVVMRSNLNGSWNRRARQGSVRKHVMSFMEYDTENDSLCSSSRRSSLRVPGKSFVLSDQGRGPDQPESSWRR